MKVCIIGNPLTLFSGHSKVAFELAKELVNNGIYVTLVAGIPKRLKPLHDLFLEREGYKTLKNLKILDLPSSVGLTLLGRNKSYRFVHDILSGDSIDIVHGFDSLTLFGLAKSYDFKAPIPIIHTVNTLHKLRAKHLRDAGVLSLLNITKPRYIFKLAFPEVFNRKVFNCFDRIITTSKYVAEDVRSLGIPSEKVETIPTGIDVQRLGNLAEDNGSPLLRTDFLYWGSGSSGRGVPDVLSAFQIVLTKHPEARLTLSLPGFHGLEESLYKYVIGKSKNQGSITLEGFNPDIINTVQSAKVIVLPFRAPYGYAHPPLVLLESMGLGKPVISTSVGSIPEVILNGKTGWLVSPRNPEALAEKMLLTYEDDELRKEVGNQAQQYIRQMHNLTSMTRKHVEVYQDAIRGFHG